MIRIFRDSSEVGFSSTGRPRTGRSAEQEAIAFYLEHRLGRRGTSIADPDRLALPHGRGRTLSEVDVDATIRAIERAIEIVPAEWRPVALVAVGWRVGVTAIRSDRPADGGPPYLDRAGFRCDLPRGLSRRAIDHWARHIRAALADHGLIDGASISEAEALETRSAPTAYEPGAMMAEVGEQPLRSWKVIARWLGCSERTARDYASRRGLPVRSVAGAVYAFPSELAAWVDAQRATGSGD